ncbi:MAG: hydrolase [Candidatus Nitricoxidivorans perseverans]|uniref:Hydrolase n=1 Tax=Candidatus Nitricoxidivorans perseverans TaxID=2975601 RepID=A0AA49IYJ6_9PROT|nr:MAG: hydrolase [Candidatus Nitricoxidivorans perseverans]
MNADESALLVIDVQERLLPHMVGWQRLLENVKWLVRLAGKMGVPVMATEQYPKGIGHTVPELAGLLPDGSVAEKIHFSCAAAGCLPGLPGGDRRQVVVCGIESHVCVLQTVLELRAQGREVFVVADAVASRNPDDRALALERMRGHGVEMVSREMVAFEWLRQAGTPLFREVSAAFLR